MFNERAMITHLRQRKSLENPPETISLFEPSS
jgi:hypothetical protein